MRSENPLSRQRGGGHKLFDGRQGETPYGGGEKPLHGREEEVTTEQSPAYNPRPCPDSEGKRGRKLWTGQGDAELSTRGRGVGREKTEKENENVLLEGEELF